MYDLDGEAAYAGKTSNLRGRLRQHFIRQDSSVVSYGRLDIWDIAYLDWWGTKQTDTAERVLLSVLNPYLNFPDEGSSPVEEDIIDTETPTGSVALASDEELEFRAEPYNRAKQKLEHLTRMIDTIKLAGHSNDTKRTLYVHKRIFSENAAEFLDVKPEEEIATLSDWTE